MKVGVIGSGSWGTALVKVLAENGNEVRWWVRQKVNVKFIHLRHRNPSYLSDIDLPKSIFASDDLKDVVSNAEAVVLAVPSAFLSSSIDKIFNRKFLYKKLIVSAIKGLEPNTNLTITDYLIKKFGVNASQSGVISGPCHAEEVAQRKISFLDVAFRSSANAKKIASALRTTYLYPKISDDVDGIQYAAVMKNIMAIAAGIFHGLGYGDNFTAVLISKAAEEIKIFLNKISPRERDIEDIPYLGDLLVTCYSQYSRNRTLGAMIGRGYSVKAAQMEMKMIAEGFYASRSLHAVNEKYKVPLPICEAVYNVLHNNSSARYEMNLLLKKFS